MFGSLATLTIAVTMSLATLTITVTMSLDTTRVVCNILAGLMTRGFGIPTVIMSLAIGNPVGSLAIGNPVGSLAIMRLNVQPNMKPVQVAGQATYVLQSPAKVITFASGILVVVEGVDLIQPGTITMMIAVQAFVRLVNVLEVLAVT